MPTTALTTAAVTPADPSASPHAPVVLFARDGDLWRTNLDGDGVERLTEGAPLVWRPGMGDWWVSYLSTPIQVSPDGRWITFLGAHARVLIDLATEAQGGMPMPDDVSPVGDWSPDSRYFAYGTDELYVHDVQTGHTTQLADPPIVDDGAGRGVREVVWSPDGQFIGFACCYVIPTDVYTGTAVGQIRRLELATLAVESMGQIDSHVAMSNHLCWTEEGELTTTKALGWDRAREARCSHGRPQPRTTSADGIEQALLNAVSLDTSVSTGATRLTVSEVATDEIIWQQEFSRTVEIVTWSPDDRYLLLDDLEPHSPIWRIESDDGTSLTLIIEDGFLVDVIPQWHHWARE